MLNNLRKLNLGQKSKYTALNRVAYYMKQLHCKYFRIMQITLRQLRYFYSYKLYCLFLCKKIIMTVLFISH